MDMDGVLIRERHATPGANRFLQRLHELGHRFLVITNNSLYTPRDLSARLNRSGLEVPENAIWTSAAATARFLSQQRPRGSSVRRWRMGHYDRLHEVGYTLTDVSVEGVINRNDFGLTWQHRLARGGVLVGEEVKIVLDVSRSAPDHCRTSFDLRRLPEQPPRTIVRGAPGLAREVPACRGRVAGAGRWKSSAWRRA